MTVSFKRCYWLVAGLGMRADQQHQRERQQWWAADSSVCCCHCSNYDKFIIKLIKKGGAFRNSPELSIIPRPWQLALLSMLAITS